MFMEANNISDILNGLVASFTETLRRNRKVNLDLTETLRVQENRTCSCISHNVWCERKERRKKKQWVRL